MDRHSDYTWRTSTRCSNGGCVEVGTTPDSDTVAVGDSKLPPDVTPILLFDSQTWIGFMSDIRAGRFDLP